MSGERTWLAGRLRQAQWACDEAAFDIGGGRYSDTQRRDLATLLEDVAARLRVSTEDAAPIVLDAKH